MTGPPVLTISPQHGGARRVPASAGFKLPPPPPPRCRLCGAPVARFPPMLRGTPRPFSPTESHILFCAGERYTRSGRVRRAPPPSSIYARGIPRSRCCGAPAALSSPTPTSTPLPFPPIESQMPCCTGEGPTLTGRDSRAPPSSSIQSRATPWTVLPLRTLHCPARIDRRQTARPMSPSERSPSSARPVLEHSHARPGPASGGTVDTHSVRAAAIAPVPPVSQ